MNEHLHTYAQEFIKKSEHTLSEGLPENSYIDIDAYLAALSPYDYTPKQDQNTDFIEKSNPNLGWKLHLNVTPNNVKVVSEYLRANGYNHKYLSGGDPADGKVFTLYIGSSALAQISAEKISKDLKDQLSRPAVKEDIEFSQGVVGRFNTPLEGVRFPKGEILPMDKYGIYGVSITKIDKMGRCE